MMNDATVRQFRTVAVMLVYMRRCLLCKVVAILKEDHAEIHRIEERFTKTWRALPIALRTQRAMEHFVVRPATRIIEREGILAQNGRYTV